jgi:NADPH:quinone reductase-like Zn-dependent oxidoreductase/acyl carrier protein
MSAALAGRDGVCLAAVNGPGSVVISGEADAVAEIAEQFGAAGRRVRPLRVSHAFHSARMDPVLAQLGQVAAGLEHAAPAVPWAGAVTGQVVSVPEAGYWPRQAREPVRFAAAVGALAGLGITVFLEIGPDATLSALAENALDDSGDSGERGAVFIPLLRSGQPAPASVITALARAHVNGTAVDWAAVLGGGTQVELPTYAFQRQRYWPTRNPFAAGGFAEGAAMMGLGTLGHPLLGAAVELAAGEGLVLTGRLSLPQQPWLADHSVTGAVLLPGTAFVEMAVRAGEQVGCDRVEELTLEVPLVVPADGAVQLQVMVGAPDQDGHRRIEWYGRPADAESQVLWTRHASGTLTPDSQPETSDADGFTVWPPQDAEPVMVDGLYEALAATGNEYGPVFRGLRAAWRRDGEIFAEVALPEDAAGEAARFGLHPALLDAVLHAIRLAAEAGIDIGPTGLLLSYIWSGVSLHAAGAAVLRARLRYEAGGAGWSVMAADGTGAPVVSVRSLVLRPFAAKQLETSVGGVRDGLFTVEWVPAVAAPGDAARDQCELLDGPGLAGVAADLAGAGAGVRVWPGPGALAAAIAAGQATVPDVVLLTTEGGAGPAAARAEAGRLLGVVQQWLDEDGLAGSRLLVVTRGAVAAEPGEVVADLAGAAVHGLVRSAQSEHPGRIVLADLPATGGGWDVLLAGLGSAEPEMAVRDGKLLGRRLARPTAGLDVPEGGPWRLEVVRPGSLDGLALVSCPQVAAPLEPGQVRVAVRAAGLNFRDVPAAPGMYPDGVVIGTEIAGIVLETGPGVAGLAAGDRVLGMAENGSGPVAVTDARLVVPVPGGWSWTQAASVPVAFVTAWYALTDLARARAGQRLLIHAVNDAVGIAAVGIARHLGLDVYATAAPGTHGLLAGLGLDARHVASSRDARFREQFLAVTDGAGMDIVLNTLAAELTDASMDLLTRGGTFLEMGRTDLRDPAQVAADQPGVAYRPFRVGDPGAERMGQILAQVTRLLADRTLTLMPLRTWDIRRAPDAFRFTSQAPQAGKIVLTIPPDPAAPRPPGTVLVTGGTGTLGGLVAGHLASTGRAARLVLTSRSGPAAPGAAALAARIAGAGVAVHVTACDTADRAALAALLAATTAAGPLTGVIHTAAVLDDGVVGSLTPARVDRVMRPKADAAWNLHELTRDADLDLFVLFSSAAGVFGSPGQGSYAAGNAFADALAAHRRAAGRPATSLAWGLWADASGLTGQLRAGDLARMTRGGINALTASEGLALLDAAMTRDEALLVPVKLDIAGLRAGAARGTEPPALLRGLIGTPARRSASMAEPSQALRQQLARLEPAEQLQVLTDLVRGQVAAVLGHPSAEAVEGGREFFEMGFDSLTAVELRNRLHTATGLRLPATLVFDYPTAAALARQLQAALPVTVTTGSGASLPGNGTPLHTLSRLYEQAARDGRTDEIMALIKGLVAFQPTFSNQSELKNVPLPVRVSRGSTAPSLICISSFVGRSGPVQYVRFAGRFHGTRQVSVIPIPGFADGEPLAATQDALIGAYAESIKKNAAGAPFVITGHSTGALAAHAVATRLEEIGVRPAGLVLIDPYVPEKTRTLELYSERIHTGVLADIEQAEEGEDYGEDARLIAMTHYLSLSWTHLGQTDIPTLVVRAQELIGAQSENAQRPSSDFSSRVDVVDVPGDHFTMMIDHADTTSQAVDEWLAGLE